MNRALTLAALTALSPAALVAQRSYTLEQIRSYPFPNEMVAAATGSRIAWAFNERGLRNIYVAEGPGYAARRLTSYTTDDGQELTSVALSANGQWVVYLRGGDHGSNWDDGLPVNPEFLPSPPKVQIWAVPFSGGEPRLLADGEAPVISPKNDVVVFERGGQFWSVPVDGATPAKQLFTARGVQGSPVWSPDGTRIAFVSNRGDRAFVGVYRVAEPSGPLQWIAPSYSRDRSPRWSPDGRSLAFVRLPGAGGAPDSVLARRHSPWSIYRADAATGAATKLWTAPKTLRGSVSTTDGGTNLHWAAGRIVFLSYQDGWPHLYSLPETGGEALLLTPGRFMAEHISMSPDRRWMVFAANAGSDSLDIDRRHVVKVPVDRAAPEVMTPGSGLEWSPVVTGDGTLAMISATTERPPLPAVMPLSGGTPRLLAADRIPADYPTGSLVVPKQVVFKAPDGVTVHNQLFVAPGGLARKPAIIYVHGGPPRQMLLGWHYSDYYSNAYATNQYLASQGYLVLSVNYRLGIGYGYEFHQPARAGTAGASEYLDVKAAALWLARQPNVDPRRIGIYGGSYGGYLVALALGRDSRLFAAGVDIHGVHDRTIERTRNLVSPDRFERAPDADLAARVAWRSSPVSSVNTWTSPVLVIHGDDDRNVRFSQSTDLVRRLEEKGVSVETLVIVDDTHHFMRHANFLRVGDATVEFFNRRFGMEQARAH
ncbi:MAG: S9 family peptidase [Gemmatimonadetes bacterium]|nr:S9 family peptidase [Gemmatimonadota bacterium]